MLAALVVRRNFLVYRRGWLVFLSGFLEPVLYLLAIGVGFAGLVSRSGAPGGAGAFGGLGYTAFVAPALMASAAMNGAIFDSTFNIFFKLKYAKTYDAMLSTPLSPADVALGEVSWAVLRGSLYSAGFLAVMFAFGLVRSAWGLLAVGGAGVEGFAFAGAGVAVTSYLRSWKDFDLIQASLMAMFLFSATFFPVSVYPAWLRGVVELSPLYSAVVLLRGLTSGDIGPSLALHAAYLALLGAAGLWVASRRLTRLLTP